MPSLPPAEMVSRMPAVSVGEHKNNLLSLQWNLCILNTERTDKVLILWRCSECAYLLEIEYM